MLTRANLATNAIDARTDWRFTQTTCCCTHCRYSMCTACSSRSTPCSLPAAPCCSCRSSTPTKWCACCREASVMMGVPTFYTRLLQHPGLHARRGRNVRLFVSGSAPLLAETHREFRARTGHAILERYGMSETLMNTSNPYDGERVRRLGRPAAARRRSSHRRSRDGARCAEAEAIGMIEVRGPNVFSGYWRMPEKTAAEFREDGFFITGDRRQTATARGYLLHRRPRQGPDHHRRLQRLSHRGRDWSSTRWQA